MYWPGDRYAEARASKEMEDTQKKEVSGWCVLFGQDPRLIDFVSSGGKCWLDVPAASGVGRLHVRPQVRVPESGARSSLFGLGIFYGEEWSKESVPWDIHIRSFDAWFESEPNSPPLDGIDLEIEEVGVADLPSPQFNLLAYIDSKEIIQGGSYTELLEQTRELVLGRTTEWFSSVGTGIACNPPVEDLRICAHLVAKNFHKPGIRPYLPGVQVTTAPDFTNESPKLNKNKWLSMALVSTGLLLLFVTFGGSFGFNSMKEIEEARKRLEAAVDSATVVSQRLEAVQGKINSDIKSLQDIVKNAKQWEEDLASAREKAEAATRALITAIEEAKKIQRSVNSPQMKDEEKSSPVDTSKNGEEIQTVEKGDSATVQLPSTLDQAQSQVAESAETSHSQPVASEQTNPEPN